MAGCLGLGRLDRVTKPDQSMRFLGFAFASADLLFEVDPKGIITFAIGAAKKVTGVGNVTLDNNSWRVLFAPSDHGVFSALINSLEGAARKGPIRCRLRDVSGMPPRYANLFACCLPQLAPHISCALSLTGDLDLVAGEHGLMDRTGFERAIIPLLAHAQASGLNVELALIEVASLANAVKTLSTDAADAVIDSLAGVLRAESISGAAARLASGQFAVVREKPVGKDTLAQRLKQSAKTVGIALEPRAAIVPLEGLTEPTQGLRALRFTLDHFLNDGLPKGADLTSVFHRRLNATMREAQAFTETVKARQFKLVFQPIVNLTTLEVHHYEALTRFAGKGSPADTIHMAEELEIIEEFDLAVAEKAIETLRHHGSAVRIAVNVSGRSFLRPKFLDRLLALTDGDVRLKDRLLFEITESAALVNLELAEERIQRLRRAGFEVCIDDFGAGAASLSYLRNLTVDVVKIDGQYVHQIDLNGRDGAVVRHLAALCHELGVRTIGEMVETQAEADKLKSLGVEMGQGFLFGAPMDQIPAVSVRSSARRTGTVDSWG